MLPNQQREPRMDYTTSFTSFVVGHQAHGDTDGCGAEGERQREAEEVERQRKRNVQLAKGDVEGVSVDRQCGNQIRMQIQTTGKHTQVYLFYVER